MSHLDWNLYLFRLPIMQALVKEGHTVYAICPKGDAFDKFDAHNIKTIDYTIERGSLNPLKEVLFIYNIYKAIKPLQLDLLHTFTAKPNIYGTLAGRAAKVPTILNLVEGLGSFYVENNFKSKIVRFVIERAYKISFSLSQGVVFVNSDDPKYLLSKHVINSNKIHIIKSVGIDTNEFSPDSISKQEIHTLKKSLHVENCTVILMIARAIWHKGVREYYEAAKALHSDQIAFILVGDTDEGNPSCGPSSFLQQPHVKWLGHREDIKELIAMSDIFVLPSYREGVPRTLLEASSMHKAIVTTNTVGCREVVEDKVNGLLVPVKDITALRIAIKTLIDNPNLRDIYATKAQEKTKAEFDIKPITKHYLNLYKKFLDVH